MSTLPGVTARCDAIHTIYTIYSDQRCAASAGRGATEVPPPLLVPRGDHWPLQGHTAAHSTSLDLYLLIPDVMMVLTCPDLSQATMSASLLLYYCASYKLFYGSLGNNRVKLDQTVICRVLRHLYSHLDLEPGTHDAPLYFVCSSSLLWSCTGPVE